VPLSEHEQRILRQIERQFQQERGLALPLRMPAGKREAARNAKRAGAGFIVGLLALLVSFASSWVVGLIGFVVMLVSTVALVQSLRRLAQVRWGNPEDDGRTNVVPDRRPGRQPWVWPGRPAGGKWWGGKPGRGHDPS
jgi:hypothetical protein